MKILLISFEFPPKPGGIGTYSYQMAKHLYVLGEQITVLAFSAGITAEKLNEFDSKSDFEIIRYRDFKAKIINIIHRINLTWKIIKKTEYDYLFITYPYAGILAYLFKKKYNIPYVVTGHGSEFKNKNFLQNITLKLTYRKADAIISNSRYTSSLIKKTIPLYSEIVIIPLGADDMLYDRHRYSAMDFRQMYNYSNNKIVLTVGNLIARKGHQIVIEAIAKLKNDIPNILYLIIGKGPEEQHLKKLIAELQLQNYVKLVGYVEINQLPEYYSMCDVFILNSTIDKDGNTEGFGIVLIEAALMGKPVIGTTNCGIEDAIENNKNGLLIPMDDSDATTSALKKILLNKELAREMGNYGYHRAKLNFTWSQVASKTQSVFQILNSNRKNYNSMDLR